MSRRLAPVLTDAGDADELGAVPLVATVIADFARDQVHLYVRSAPELLPIRELTLEVRNTARGLSFAEREAFARNIARRLNRVADRLTRGVR